MTIDLVNNKILKELVFTP